MAKVKVEMIVETDECAVPFIEVRTMLQDQYEGAEPIQGCRVSDVRVREVSRQVGGL